MTSNSQSASSDSASIWSELARKPEDSFPNHLLDPVGAVVLPRRGVLLAVLMLFCLAMQTWSASRWHIVWPDTVDYIRVSQALDRGDPQPMVDQFGLNVYPLILTGLHRLGGDWELAGQAWSVAMASLVVLPLFGWLRRQFDDATAAAGCALYAIHPKLLISSALIIRDPTFWLLLTLTVYLAWRAVLELKPWLFAAAGVALALAIHTRTEGLLLLAPLVLWAVFRWPAVGGHRLRLALGGLLCLAMIPAWVLLMNVTLLRGHSWVLVHSIHIPGVILGDESPDASAQAVSAGHSASESPQGAAKKVPLTAAGKEAVPAALQGNKEISPVAGRVTGPPQTQPLPPPPLPWRRTVEKVVVRLVKATTYAYGFLVLLVLWLWPRVFLRRDQQAMFLFGVLLWLAIAVRTARGSRHPLLPSRRDRVGGLCGLGLALDRQVDLPPDCRPRGLDWAAADGACFALVAAVFAMGTRDRALNERQFMVQHADLGKWILDRFGPHQRLIGALYEMRLVSYYSQGDIAPNYELYYYRGDGLIYAIQDCKPDVLMLWGNPQHPTWPSEWRKLLDERPDLGLCRVPSDQLPRSCQTSETVESLIVAVRKELLHAATRSGKTSR